MNTNYRRSAVALFSLSFGTFYSKIIAYLLMTDLYRYLPQFFRVETSLSHFDLKYDLSSLKVFYYIIAYYVTL